MGRISLLGTGNVAFSGNEIYSTNNNSLLFGNDLIPTTVSTFSIGSSAFPFQTLFISASTLQMAAPLGGNSLSILNDGSNFQISNGGLRSTVIYTGGLLLSGNNIGADPSVGTLPMNIGTNGLPSVNFLAPLSAQSSTYLNNTSATNLNVVGKGFIQTFSTGIRVVPTTTNVTALSVDFLNDSFVHCHSNGSGGSLTITPINVQYGAGRRIDVLVFNPIGGTLQITTNLISSRNTTYGASFVLDSSPSQVAHLTYMCIDGTLDNTFISAVYK